MDGKPSGFHPPWSIYPRRVAAGARSWGWALGRAVLMWVLDGAMVQVKGGPVCAPGRSVDVVL